VWSGAGWGVGSGAFRETEQVVGLLAVALGFEVFVAIATHGHDYPHRMTADRNHELPLAALDAGDGVLLGKFPAGATGDTANGVNALMRS